MALDEAYLTENLYRYTNVLYSIADKVYSHLYLEEGSPFGYTAENALKVLKDAEYIRAQHILVKFPDAPTEGTEEEKAAKKKHIKEEIQAYICMLLFLALFAVMFAMFGSQSSLFGG